MNNFEQKQQKLSGSNKNDIAHDLARLPHVIREPIQFY